MALTFNVFCKSDNYFSTSFLHTPQTYFTFAKQIFHIKDISLVPTEQISLKKARNKRAFFCERATKRCISGGKNDQKYGIYPFDKLEYV